MEFFQVKAYSETLKIVGELIKGFAYKSKVVAINEALNKTLAKDIISFEDLPNFDKSTVDGYAVKANNTHGASEALPTLLTLIGSVSMGESFDKELTDGQTVYVPTGAKIPNGSDSVVMIENCEIFGKQIAINKSIAKGTNIIKTGDDVCKKTLIASKGDILTPFFIGVLAGLGVKEVEVFDTIKFGIISTGDELVGIEEKAENGKIRDINTHCLSALIMDFGGEVVFSSRLNDDYDALLTNLEKATKFADVVLISGGSSVGIKDFTYRAIENICGEVKIKGIAIKPGKPTIIGSSGSVLVAGLPGHPMAAALVFETVIKKAITLVRGQKEKVIAYAYAKNNFPSTPGRTTCQLVSLQIDSGKAYISPLFAKSGIISALKNADGYIIIEENDEGIAEGRLVKVYGF